MVHELFGINMFSITNSNNESGTAQMTKMKTVLSVMYDWYVTFVLFIIGMSLSCHKYIARVTYVSHKTHGTLRVTQDT